MTVERFKNATHPCPICGGNDRNDRSDRAGAGRCGGFQSGNFAHCTSNAHAGGLQRSGSGCFVHLLEGRCNCGQTHGSLPATAHAGPEPAPIRKLVKTYDYTDERGNLLYQVCRYEPKGFSQRRPGNLPDEWVYNLKDTRRVLYRLPELVASVATLPVFIPEGEKDVDNLIAAGLIATCNPQGAGKWQSDYNLALKGRNVAILPDNDEVGREHAVQIAKQLHGIALSVTIIHLQGLGAKGDVSDWLQLERNPTEKLFLLLETTSTWSPEREATPEPAVTDTIKEVLSGIISATDLMKKEFEPIRWVIPDLLPEGLGLCAGRPKMGKSWLWLHFAIAVASGGCALSAIELGGQPAEVLYLALEDNERRLQDRIRKIGIDHVPATLHLHTQWPRVSEGCEVALENWLQNHPAARLVVIDTLAKVKNQASRNQGIYDAEYNLTQGLKALVDKYRVALVVLHHTRKAAAEDALEEISGSFGISAGVDTLMVLKRPIRKEVDAVFEIIGRDMPETKELALQWEPELALWRLMGDAQEYEGSKQRREILSLLHENPEGMSAKEIADHLSKNWEATRRLLYELKKSGYIDGSERGKVKISPMGEASL